MPTINLNGCAPIPLAHYLKGLGILRLVAEQADANVRGLWLNDHLLLNSTANEAAVVEFLACNYQPTAVLAPGMAAVAFSRKIMIRR